MRFQRYYAFLTLCVVVGCGLLTLVSGCTTKTAETTEVVAKDNEKAENTDTYPTADKTIIVDPAGAKQAGIAVRPVVVRSLRGTLSVSGVVEAANDRIAKITPPVAGKITALPVRIGSAVRQGQIVAVLDSYEVAQAHATVREAGSRISEAQAVLRTAQAEANQTQARRQSAIAARTTQEKLARAGAFSEAPLQGARAELSDAQSDLIAAQTEQQSHAVVYERNERLFKEGIISRSELDASQLERQQDATRVGRARAQVDSAKQTLARQQRVAQGGLLNRQAVQTADAEVRAADAELQKASRQVEAAQTALMGARQAQEAARTNLRALVGAGQVEGNGGMVVVRAPLGGVLSEQNATLGEAVDRTSVLFVIQNLQSVIVEAQIPEADVAVVRVGQHVEVIAASFPKTPFLGVVQSLASSVSEKTRTLAARCIVANPKGLLRPEMFATVQVTSGASHRVVAVPQSALVSEDNKTYVFVATDKNGYEKREVQVGAITNGGREITSGIKEGEPVVVSGAYVLRSESHKGELKEEE